MAVVTAIGMAVVAAVLFAVAAVRQNGAVTAVVGLQEDRRPSVGVGELRELARSRTWVGGVALTAGASVLHAGALFLAPVVIVQPIGVLAVPFAVLLAARRTGVRPPAGVVVAVVACLAAVTGFVVLADAALASSPAPRFAGALAAAGGTALLAAVLALVASTRSGWQRCAGFAAAGATAYGLVSALMRLVSLHLASGVNDLDDVGVLLPVAGIVLALVGGGWAIQQAHAAGAPAVVVGCTTVVDPLVAVGLGATMLGEGTATAANAAIGLVVLAAVALGAALVLAERHPDAVAAR
jgi:hypothetical protein